MVIAATNRTGKIASPMANPVAEMASALPRVATNHRAMATAAMWLVIPCPVNRSRKIDTGSKAANGFRAMNRQAKGQSREHDCPERPNAQPIRQNPGPDHDDGRCGGANGIDQAPISVGQGKGGHDLTGEDRDEEGLSEAGGKAQQTRLPEENGRIVAQEGDGRGHCETGLSRTCVALRTVRMVPDQKPERYL